MVFWAVTDMIKVRILQRESLEIHAEIQTVGMPMGSGKVGGVQGKGDGTLIDHC